ncbi:MAG: hypothetical protein IT379_00755, partial [Deltaproteobacteria bacterium]|nr:hypothetical protein [Deltaproteobacteria bacterium]
PRFVDAHLALADALAGLGEHGEAIEVYDQLLRIDRTNAQAAHNRDVLERARAQARANRWLGRDRDALSSSALVGQSGMKLEAAWSAPSSTAKREALVPRLLHRWPAERTERWSDRVADLYVDIAAGLIRAVTLVLRDPEAAARQPDRWGLQLVGGGEGRDVDYATGAHVALIRDALGLTLTESARIWRTLAGSEARIIVDDAVVERATIAAPDDGRELAGVRVARR